MEWLFLASDTDYKTVSNFGMFGHVKKYSYLIKDGVSQVFIFIVHSYFKVFLIGKFGQNSAFANIIIAGNFVETVIHELR